MARRFRRSGAGCRHVRLTIITLNEHKIGGILIRSNPKIHSRAVLCPRRVIIRNLHDHRWQQLSEPERKVGTPQKLTQIRVFSRVGRLHKS
ncbi:uncharacterized protein LOC116172246 isoform X3 [Photinus pyralis]|uniref:uncharacterized protein LOC116172246 isoform X3 n=1 Tax=Photinus pyralis TaxID=7054 RepID=UPI001266F4A1|nr:uncharacterized protein LOC116172246 isoform X3 [Photinus pyralis]